MPISLANVLQARYRQTLALRGGGLISAPDFVQPTVQLGSAEGPHRNPALEEGIGITKNFVASSDIIGPTALQFSTFQIRTSSSSTLLHIHRVIVSLEGSTTALLIGRAAAVGLTAQGAFYPDLRLPALDLGATGTFLVQGAPTLTPGTFVGTPVRIHGNGTFTSRELEIDFVVTEGAGFQVQAETVNTQISVSVFGTQYDFGPGAR